MFEESRTAQSAAGPEIDRLRRRGEELLREVRRQNNDRTKFDAPLLRNRTDLESHKSSELMHLRASADPPDPTRDSVIQDLRLEMDCQEAKRDFQATQDSPNSWDEVNFNSIQGVYVDDSIGTSISSVSRVTEPAIGHPPQAGCDRDLHLEGHSMSNAAPKLNADPSTSPASISKNPVAVHNSLFRRLLYQLNGQLHQSPSLIYGGLNKRDPEQIAIDKWPQTTKF